MSDGPDVLPRRNAPDKMEPWARAIEQLVLSLVSDSGRHSSGITAARKSLTGLLGTIAAHQQQIDEQAAIVLPAEPPAAPTAPTLRSSLGNLYAAWDGELLSGAPGPGFKHIRAQVASSVDGPWNYAGLPASAISAEVVIGNLAVGGTFWVRFVAFNQADMASPAGDADSAIVTGVDLGSLDEDLRTNLDTLEKAQQRVEGLTQEIAELAEDAATIADTALISANGKGRNLYGTAAERDAKAPFTEHDTWFDTANGNRIHEWKPGQGWIAKAFGSPALADLAVIADKIANDAVGTRHLVENAVTRAQIAEGAVGTSQIADFALTVKKMKSDRHQLY